jgi:two-component system NtrC family sensor kinase
MTLPTRDVERSQKILIIDDSAELRALLDSVLPYSGYETHSAPTAEEGLALARQVVPDLVVVDFELPDARGLDVLTELEKLQPGLPTILMTGYGSEGVAARALRLGALGYLIKPFTIEEMLSSVERALAVGKLRREKAQLSTRLDAYRQHLRALAALGRALVDGMAAANLLERIVQAGVFVTRAERCMLALNDEDGESFRIVVSSGSSSFDSECFTAKSGDERLWPVLGDGASVRLAAETGKGIRLQTGDETQALVQVAVQDRFNVLGLVSVDRPALDLAFSSHDQAILEILASYAVLVMEREEDSTGKLAILDGPRTGGDAGR